jgi:hypothetical protein
VRNSRHSILNDAPACGPKLMLQGSAAAGAGWIEKLDPSNGRPYYVNAATGEKSWTRPAALAAIAVPQHPTAAAAIDRTAPLQVNAGWIEKLDPGSGRSYFVNSLSGEKSWTRPAALAQAAEAAVAAASTPEAPAGAAAEATADVLAQGWIEKLDPGSGRSYFVNSLSGEKTWTRPEALAQESEAAEAPAAPV